MLYWAEGTKSRNTATVGNSDPHLLRLFSRFLVECLGVRRDDFVIHLNVYLGNGLSLEDVERYWLDLLDLPPSCLRKHSVDFRPTSSSGSKIAKLPYGVCSVRVHSTRVVQHIYGAIQEYAGIERLEWLD